MSDLFQGEIFWEDKNNKLMVKRTSKKGECKSFIDEWNLCKSLKNSQESNGTKVEFELILGNPIKIRPVGKEFLPRPTPQHRSQQNNRNIAHHQQHQTQQVTQVQILPQEQFANSLLGSFHNPYNFIPTPARNTKKETLGDHSPAGHETYHLDLISGVISVKMKTNTPLLIPDAPRTNSTNVTQHKIFPLRVDSDGNPLIPPTSIKGMLRSAFEAITNSRMAVFSDHYDRLAYRLPADQGSKFIPARVTDDGKSIELLPGSSDINNDGSPKGPMYAAWLKRYNPDTGMQDQNNSLSYPDGTQPKHGEKVTCWLVPCKHTYPNFSFWGIKKIFKDHFNNQEQPEEGVTVEKVNGYVCITNRNMRNKHDERVFFNSNKNRLLEPTTSDLCNQWKELITNYQKTHEKELNLGKAGPAALRNCFWSRHITGGANEQSLSSGTLCFAEYINGKITSLFPVMISRRLYEASPISLIDKTLLPASELNDLSPADRVFGWVNNKRNGSYCGNVRFNQVICKTENSIENFGDQGLPLAILGQPMPQQARFYVAQNPQGLAQPRNLSKKESGYSEGKGLRGRKVYPHHSSLSLNYWTQNNNGQPNNQEYRRVGNTRDNQNRSIQSWVKPESEFTFELQVTNLSRSEIGALLWLLSLPEKSYHRFGGGKPLGFGSVHLSIDKTQLLDGKGWKEFYSDINNTQQSGFVNCKELIECFEKSSIDFFDEKVTFNEIPYIKAFLRMSTGHPDQLPTFYPRNQSQPNNDGEGFRWFTGNEKSDKLTLPDLASDSGLPYLQ